MRFKIDNLVDKHNEISSRDTDPIDCSLIVLQ